MIYLSRLIVEERTSRVRRDLGNPYEMHRTISKGFGDAPGDWENARTLFRFDEDPKPHILVQSLTEPNWQNLPSGYLKEIADVKPVDIKFIGNTVFAFRLRANPTVKREGKRRGLLNEEAQLQWLSRKGDIGGFKLLNASILQEPITDFCTASGQNAIFASVRFDGVLIVTDPLQFGTSFEHGVGSGKGVGFGLLSLARRK